MIPFKFIFLFFVFWSGVPSLLNAQKVGLLMDSYIIDRWYIDEKLFTSKVKELGGECVVEVPHGDADEQLRLAKKLIEDKVDVLVVVPVDGQKAVAIVEAAKQAGIPVISYDRFIASQDVSFYISFDNEKVGKLQAQYALRKMPSGNYILINGPVSDNNSIAFHNGQLSVLKPYVDSKKIRIVADFVLHGWSELEAMMKTDEYLTNNKAIPNVIIAANDAVATGAIQALPEELVSKVIVTGQDADRTSLKNIIAGKQSMTIYKPIKPLATKAAEIAIQLAKGEHAQGTKLKFNGIEVDAILLEPIVVDKTNYKETVVKDGHISLAELAGK
ncbi:substrate-binding domain-containing protein [Chryseosolibacter indicus]|uniref:Substrate-binding domain-containing protein n=1 Tax=Chryseosolibacter indicus TaxID=2782351 RepID=A0ABS5VL42_9BACT|nr:substrate-binding domain-containing protein [Chryseosolibacter indicus]MBT1702168.1 substrate-binding domain-containing protein [Chryseosolibacter indicus]